MAWFNEGLSSLKGQISNLTKEIVVPTLLSENSQDEGEVTNKQQVDVLEDKCRSLEQEVERLKYENTQLRQLDGSLQSSISSPEVATLDCEVQDDDFDDSFQAIGWGDDVWTDSFLGQEGEDMGERKAKELKPEDEIANLQKQVSKLLLDKRKLKQRCIHLDSQVELLSEQLGRASKVEETKPPKQNQLIQTSEDICSSADYMRMQQEFAQLREERAQLRTELSHMSRVVQDLESQVRVSQDENANLSTGLEELDIQHQEAIEQMMLVKDTTQKRYETLSAEFEGLKSKYEELQSINEKLSKTTKVEINKVEEVTQTENLSAEEEIKSTFEKKLSSDIENLISFNVPQQYFESSESGDSVLNTIRAVIKLCDNTLSEKNNGDKKIAELNSKLQEIEGEIDALEHENMGLQASVERLNKQCESLQPISEGNEELEALDQKVNMLEKEVNILREVRSNLEVELDNARSTVYNLTHRLQSNEAIIKNQDNLQNELALVQASEQSLREELDALLKIKDSIEKENFELKQKESKDDDAVNKFEEIQDKHLKEIEKEACKNKDLELEITSSKEEIQKLRKEILLLNESCQEKEIKFKELDTTYNNACKKLSMLEAKCSELDEVIVSLTIEKESKERKMCELILEKSTSDKHLEELKQVHENVDAHIQELQKTSSVKDSEISNLKLQLDELNIKFSDVNKSFGEILNENNNLKLQITNFDTELRNKNTEIENVQLDFKKFSEDKYSLLEKNYSEKSQLCDSLQQKSMELEKMVFDLKQTLKNTEEEKVLCIDKNTEFESIQQKCIELETVVEDLKHKLSMSQDKYSTLEQNHLEKYSEIEALQLRCSELENKIDKLQVTIKVAEEDKCSIMKQYSLESENENNKLQQKCTELETVIANFEQQLKTAEEENSSLSEKLNNIICELNDKSDCLQKISCQLKQSEEMKIELEKNCFALQQELEIMQKDGENFEKSKERHEMALDSITRLSQVVADREKESEELKQTCKTLQENLYQQMPKLLDERDQLIKSLQAKHMEVMEYHNEIQRLNKLLSDELNKTAKLTTDVSVLNANYVDLQQQYQEKEERLRYQDKELLGLNQQVDTLQSQLEYASQLLRVADRQEAEGQPSTDTNAINAQLVSPVVNEQDKEFIINLEKERNELAENLLKEQTRNKYLQNEVQEHHEKEMSLAKELERLRSHLVSVEENYTHEMVRAEEQVKELQMRLSQADERVKNSSTAYTSASIRANQQVETLQAQARLVAEQRDKIQLQLSASEDKIQKQGAALTNLQIVLEQFQRDKERDIALETERIKQSLQQAHERNDALKDEVKSLQVQLREAKEGLNAAGRLGEQLERKDQAISDLKLEVEELTEKIHKLEEKIKATSTGVEGKVDRYLVKNLLVGYLCASQQSRVQALRVLATVVDLSHEERQKVGLEPASSSDTLQQQSLSEAFVRFLENESRPQPPLRLPLAETSEPKSRRSSSVLLPDVLPNIPQFTAVRNSGSILKDVLKDDRL